MAKGTGGALPLARSLLDSDIWERGPLAVEVWIWLLLRAVYSEDGFTMDNGIHVQRGQLWTTWRSLPKAFRYRVGRGYNEPPLRTLRGILESMEEEGMVAIEAIKNDAQLDAHNDAHPDSLNDAHLGIIVTICNYDTYNPRSEKARTPSRAEVPMNDVRKDAPEEERVEEEGVEEGTPYVAAGAATELSPTVDQRIASLKLEYPEVCQILNERWVKHAPLPKRALSLTGKLGCMDTIRLMHTEDGLTWEQIGSIVEHAATVWQPQGFIGSPAALRKTTRKGDRLAWEVIRQQLSNPPAATTDRPAKETSKDRAARIARQYRERLAEREQQKETHRG